MVPLSFEGVVPRSIPEADPTLTDVQRREFGREAAIGLMKDEGGEQSEGTAAALDRADQDAGRRTPGLSKDRSHRDGTEPAAQAVETGRQGIGPVDEPDAPRRPQELSLIHI